MKRKLISLSIILGTLLTTSMLQAEPYQEYIHPGTGERIKKPDKTSSRAEWKRYHDFQNYLYKASGRIDRAVGIHKGNRVRTLFYNYGTIGKPNTEPSLEWPIGSNEGYGFEFGIIVGARVRTANNAIRFILSESLDDGDRSPGGASWGWEPLAGYHDPTRSDIAMSTAPDNDYDHKPDSWPASWWDSHFQDYIWPGEYGYGITTADEESYWVMDDYYNKEFNRTFFDYPSEAEDPSGLEIYHSDIKDNYYYPDENDYERGGLGLTAQCRGYQWAHTLAQDCIFFIYEITNIGTRNLDRAIFGMFGDPHVGGANDYGDDDAYYDTKIDMVYAWDHDFRGDGGFKPGYFGYKFLESPGEPYDGIDNDDDGMIDESMQDGIDNDGDWMPFEDYNSNGIWDPEEELNDDLGCDGVGPKNVHYPGPDLDGSEGNGSPDPGEPNYDGTDLDEADQIGLTAFSVFGYHDLYPSDDEAFYNLMNSAIIDSAFSQTTDNVFLYSSGTIKLQPEDTRRFSIALLFGYDKQDLYNNAAIVQQIYNAGYRFVKAPEKPQLTAIPGNGRVTLYWDTRSESSRDPVYEFDFEGYAIYRATDFGFNDPFTITDSQGNPKLWKPLVQFDLVDEYAGPHPVEQVNGIHYYMGNNSGLRHSYVDTTVTNGMTYYYAVVAYDTGSVIDKVPPTECTKSIERTVTGDIRLDINTAMVTPQAPSAGYQPPIINLLENNSQFGGTGTIRTTVIDPTQIQDDQIYVLQFIDESMDGIDNDHDGLIDAMDGSELARNTVNYSLFNITDTANPIPLFEASKYLSGEDHNPYIDGLKIQVWNDQTQVIPEKTRWTQGNCNYLIKTSIYTAGTGGVAYPADFELTIHDQVIGKSYNNKDIRFSLINLTTGDTADFVYFPKTKDGRLVTDDRIVPVLLIGSTTQGTWDIRFEAPARIVQEMFQDASGAIWYGSNGEGLARQAAQDWTTWNNKDPNSPDIQGNFVTSFAESMGLIYIGTETGLNTWNGYEILEINDELLIDKKIRVLLTDSDGNVWVGTASGISIIPAFGEIYNIQLSETNNAANDIYVLYRDQQDRIWVGTGIGISLYANDTWTHYTDFNTNNARFISFAEWDGQLWAGSSKGLYSWSSNNWLKVTSSTLPDQQILAMCPYQNQLYLAVDGGVTEDGLYSTSDGNNFTRYALETGDLTSNEVSALLVDNRNRLIVGNRYGLDFYSEATGWDSSNPQPGDVMRFYTRKPFSSVDVYQFSTTAAHTPADSIQADLDEIAVVPNPYIASAIWEPKPDFVVGRGERKIYFINLPSQGTIRIYTLNGELVKTMPIENNIFNGAVAWNLLNEDNLEIAYGLYIYHVDADDAGTKIGKFAIVK
jgi:hypothetical protein